MKLNKLGNVISIAKGKKHLLTESRSQFSKRLIVIDDLRNDNNIKYTDNKQGTNVDEKDLLIAWDGANAGTIGYGKTGFIGSTIARLRIKDPKKYYTPFLGKFLQGKFTYLRRSATGATIPHINRKALEILKFPVFDYEDQIRIATLLSRAETLIAKRKESIRLLDELVKSTFLEMFGDPVKNEKGWEKRAIKEHIGKVITGNTPPRNNKAFYNEKFIEWIKTDNIFESKMFITEAREYLSKLGLKDGRCINDGSLLVTCIAGSIKSIGTSALTNRMVAFNQQINAIEPFDEINSYFLYWLFRVCKKYIQSHATKGMKKIITKSEFEKIKMIKPDFNLQNKFAQIVEKAESIKTKYEASLKELENLYGSLSQRAFRGELDLSRIPVVTAIKPETVELKLESYAPEVKITKRFSEKELLKIIKSKSGQSFNFDEMWNRLDASSFEEQPQYDDVKKMIFNMLEGEEPLLSQSFAKQRKEIVLRVNV